MESVELRFATHRLSLNKNRYAIVGAQELRWGNCHRVPDENNAIQIRQMLVEVESVTDVFVPVVHRDHQRTPAIVGRNKVKQTRQTTHHVHLHTTHPDRVQHALFHTV